MIHGQTVFAQLIELLPRKAFDNAVRRYHGQRRVRLLSCMDQLLCMIFAQVTGRSSLRETVLCLRALGTRRYHLYVAKSDGECSHRKRFGVVGERSETATPNRAT